MRAALPSGVAWAALLLALPGSLRAAGTNSAEFLRMGMGGPSALSEASGSVDRGPTAMFWNPAGLAGMARSEAYASNLGLPQGVNGNFLGAAFPVSTGPLRGVLGVGFQLLNQEPIDRINNRGTYTGRFASNSEALSLSWAREFGLYRAGGTVRGMRESIEDSQGYGLALDLGVQRDTGRLSLGAALTNVGPGLAVGGLSAPLPTTLRMGASYAATGVVTVAADVSRSEGRGLRGHLGTKVLLWGPLSVGIGYMANDASQDGPNGMAAGIRIDTGKYKVDIAYRPYGEFGAALQLGVGARFGGEPSPAVK